MESLKERSIKEVVAENFPNFTKITNLNTPKTEKTSNRIIQSPNKYKLILCSEYETKKQNKIPWKHLKHINATLRGNTNSNGSRFLTWNYRGQKKMAHVSSAERKERLTQNSMYFQKWRGNQDVLRWWKTQRIYHWKTYPKRMAKRSSLNRC